MSDHAKTDNARHLMMTRRHLLGKSATGIGSLGLASVLNESLFSNTTGPFPGRAKRVIYLFQSGCPSEAVSEIQIKKNLDPK